MSTVHGRACARVAAWEEWAWCAAGRGVLRLPRRGVGAARLVRAAPHPLTALALAHAAMFPRPPGECLSLPPSPPPPP